MADMPPSQPLTSLRLDEVTIRRGRSHILSDLSLTVRPGSVFWVTGPNGAGKSSLLRVMALLDAPRSGRVLHAAPLGLRFRYFHSEMALPGASTVGAWARTVKTLLTPTDPGPTSLLPDLSARRRVARLSTGERKRLLLDALLRAPGPLLLDEPYEHLSPDARRSLGNLLDARAREHVVVVATNQATERARTDGGLRIHGGMVERYEPYAGEVPR